MRYPFNLTKKSFDKIVRNMCILTNNIRLFNYYYETRIPFCIGGVWHEKGIHISVERDPKVIEETRKMDITSLIPGSKK